MTKLCCQRHLLAIPQFARVPETPASPVPIRIAKLLAGRVFQSILWSFSEKIPEAFSKG
jgi:hypothetical protein